MRGRRKVLRLYIKKKEMRDSASDSTQEPQKQITNSSISTAAMAAELELIPAVGMSASL